MASSTYPATGSRGRVSLGLETEYGVYVSPTHSMKFTSESMSASEDNIRSEGILSDRGYHNIGRGNLTVGGDLNFEQSASGFGLLLYNALGDYVGVEKVDGGIHARVAEDAADATTVPSVDTNPNASNEIIQLADESTVDFPTTDMNLAIFYRDAANTLSVDDNSATGHAYVGTSTYSVGVASAVTDPDTGYTGYSATDVVSVTVAPIYDADGNQVNIEGNPAGGVLLYGSDRAEVTYFEVEDLGAGSGTKFYLDPSQAIVGDSTTYPAVDDAIIVKSTVTFAPTYTPGNLATGSWIAYWHTDYSGVWTHFLERGVALPTGLTVEIDRDAAIFLYTGNKVSTLNLTFEPGAIVTGSVTLTGRAELSIAKLDSDVVPGATEIFIEDRFEAPFPTTAQIAAAGTPAVITIGERTDITYTTKEVDYSGTGLTRLSGIPASGDNAIDRLHLKGTNVDSRTSIRTNPSIDGITDPLTSFETVIYMDGFYEEILSASITLNNNINEDKFGLGDRFALQKPEERAEVEANISVEFDDGKHYIKFIEGVYFTMEFRCVATGDGSEIGTTGVFSQAYYFLPKCKFNGNTPNIESESYITHDMPVLAIVDDALDTTDLIIILVNGLENDVLA